MLTHALSDDLALVLLEPRHADALFRLIDRSRDHLRPWMPWVDGTRSVNDVLAFVRGTQRQFGENQGFQTVLLVRGEVAGMIGYREIDWDNRSTSLGYWIGAEHQGRGWMTRACRAYVGHAFDALELNRVEIRAATENRRSRAIPERLGFRLEGTVRGAERIGDRFVDHAVYGLLRDEWRP